MCPRTASAVTAIAILSLTLAGTLAGTLALRLALSATMLMRLVAAIILFWLRGTARPHRRLPSRGRAI